MSSKRTPSRRHLQVSLKKARREPRRRAKKMPSEGNFKRSSRRRRQKTPSSVLQQDIMSILRRCRPEDTLKNLSRRFVESQEDAAKKTPPRRRRQEGAVRRRRPEDCQSAACFSTEKITVEKHRILSVLGVSFKKALP